MANEIVLYVCALCIDDEAVVFSFRDRLRLENPRSGAWGHRTPSMHRRGSNPSRENYGFFLMRWGSEARGAGENGVWKATRKGKMMGRGWQKGNEKRETKRNPLPLEPARSKKGNVKRGKSQNMLPFPTGCGKKGNEKRETKRNPMLLEQKWRKKWNEKIWKPLNI